MKFILVRPGPEIVEKTLFGPWKPELNLEPLYNQPGEMFRFLCMFQIVSSTPLLAIGSWLKTHGEDVEILEVPLEFGLPLRENQNQQRRDKILHYFEQNPSDVIGISCTSTFESLGSIDVAEAAKKAQPDTTVILGGYQAGAVAEELMRETDAIDITVMSDFEPIAEELIQALGDGSLENVPNIMYRDKKNIHQTQYEVRPVNLNEVPCYDFSLVEKYLPFYIMFSIESSRGCAHKCSYCQEGTFRHYYAVKESGKAVDEIVKASNYVASERNLAYFYYSDPLWGLKRSWVRQFCEELIERREEIKVKHFGWFTCTRVGHLKDKEFELLKKAGCANIGYGIESLSPQMLKIMGRAGDYQKYLKDVHETVDLTLKHNIQMYVSIMVGMPGETPETLQETLQGLKELPVENDLLRVFVFLAYPLPKTLLEQQLTDEEFVKKMGIHIWDLPDWRKGYFPKVTPLFDPSPELTTEELTTFYLKLSNGEMGIPSFLKKLEALKGVKDILTKDEITPEDYMKWANLYRKLLKVLG
ncbi:MAG: B12-binding domain-containing radical SAM protein [Theionarchaea archaeon]|nr:B12-binding domain-containing radical SAM protein [Theionarchaea archaeon]